MNNSRKRSLTGIRPSGTIHIGNYLGAIKPALECQKEYECLYFIADLHALTTNKDAGAIREQTLDIVATWVALGLDIEKHLLYRQSDVPMVTEFAWYLSCCTGVGFLEKAHAYKDAVQNNRDVNHGFLAYPVLMAADIVMYDVDIVPVGKDQKQHVEMARDMAGALNAAYKQELLKLPQPVIHEQVMTIPGLDGRKMSKSYKNEIPLFSPEEVLRKRVMSIKTDSTPIDQPKSLKDSLLGELFKLFATPDEVADLEARLNNTNMGWGHAKEELFDVINRDLQEPRQRYLELRKDEAKLCAILSEGAKRAYTIGRPVLDRIRKATGVGLIP
ncbi:MAG: tryptophan--tRNA ligase [Deltaproteobacteria bacterium]|jgi:tryptophanyl-tRNA synthetase|nr:tryptophan--tRNA ligase [Deltaproteobacteria bacterium]